MIFLTMQAMSRFYKIDYSREVINVYQWLAEYDPRETQPYLVSIVYDRMFATRVEFSSCRREHKA